MSAPAWDGYVLEPFDVRLVANASDALLESYVRDAVVTIYHPASTARMVGEMAGEKEGVVDSRLLLKGAIGVRIVGDSVSPSY